MSTKQKTNAVRILESQGISFETATYDVSEEHEDAVTIAHRIGANPDIVFKTLVAYNDKDQVFVFCVPGSYELNLKKCAATTKSKKILLVNLNQLLSLTGYVRGGCSPIGMKKQYPTYIDETALLFEKIYVNAGRKGQQLILEPKDLALACDGKIADLI